MKKLFALLGFTALFAFALGMTSAVHADDTLTTDEASGTLLDSGVEPDHHGRGGRRGRHPGDACARAAREVAKICPCEGIDGTGWTDHDEYMQCVNTAIADLGVDEECAGRISAKSAGSGIGSPGHVCPEPGCGRGHRRPTEVPPLP